jgi:hypothetical protein
MVYMLMIYAAEADWVHQRAAEMGRTMEGHQALENDLRGRGKFRGGGGLALVDSATTIRYRGGKPTITDGPFAETKEQLGGFYLVEAENLDEALAYAKRIPGVENRAIEVRSFLHFSAP